VHTPERYLVVEQNLTKKTVKELSAKPPVAPATTPPPKAAAPATAANKGARK